MRLLLAASLLAVGCGTTQNRPVHHAAPSEAGVKPTEPRVVARGPVKTEAAQAGADPAAADPLPAGTADSVPIIARVGGQVIPVEKLLGAWVHRESRSVRGYLEELVLSEVVMLEAARLGVELPQSALDEELTAATDRLRGQIRQTGGGESIDEFLEQRLGLEPGRYISVLREQTAIDLYAARIVRAWMLMSERAELRLIVTDTEDAIRDAQSAIDGGEDFDAVCKRFSIDDGAATGGHAPPVVRGPSAMARLAFSTPVGSVGGPVFEGERWLLVRVDARPAPLTGGWDVVGPLVERSLALEIIQDPEYWQWKDWVFDQYEVDMSPFRELTGRALAD